MQTETVELAQEHHTVNARVAAQSGLDALLHRLSNADSLLSTAEIVDTLATDLGENQAKEIGHFIDSTRDNKDDEKFELISVVMILKLNNQLLKLNPSSLNQDVHAIMSSVFGLFKYHFQLPSHHPNYAFGKFGHLLAGRNNVLFTFLSILDLDSSFDHAKVKCRMIFTMLLIFHAFSKSLVNGLRTFMNQRDTIAKLSNTFKLDVNQQQSVGKLKCPSVLDIFRRFKCSVPLEVSTFKNDYKYDTLLNTIFRTSHYNLIIHNFINAFGHYQTLEIDKFEFLEDKVAALSLNSLKHESNQFAITMRLYHNPQTIEVLDKLCEFHKSLIVKDAATFLLINSLDQIYTNCDLYQIDDEFLSLSSKYWNANFKHYHQLLGICESRNFKMSIQLETLLPLFEFRDQNFKLHYPNENILLNNLNISLLNVNTNLNTLDEFVALNNLFIDSGCSLSIGSFFDCLSVLLIKLIHDYKMKRESCFIFLPEEYIKVLSLDGIPPVYRDDISFQSIYANNVNGYVLGEFFHLMLKTQTSDIANINRAILHMEQALIHTVSIKFKIFQYLINLNNDTNVMRVVDPFSESSLDEYQIYKFKNTITKIGMFRTGKYITYKLLTPAVKLSMISNLASLILSNNYKTFKSYQSVHDSSFTEFLDEYLVSSLAQFVLIYQEFGIIIMFKMIKKLNESNINSIIPTANVLSKLLPMKSFSNTGFDSTFEKSPLAEVLSQSTICSNLVRQYVELFDDGQSKPFKVLNKYLKSYPSTLKPSKIPKGVVQWNIDDFLRKL